MIKIMINKYREEVEKVMQNLTKGINCMIKWGLLGTFTSGAVT